MQSYVWPRLRHVIGEWVARTTDLPAGAILWSEQNQPSPALPYIGLTRRDLPMDGDDAESLKQVTTGVTLTVTASVAGESAKFILFGTPYAYTLVGADTATEARDDLLAQIEADLIRAVSNTSLTAEFGVGYQPCTAVASGADAIDFAGLGAGPVTVAAVEGCTLSGEVLAYRNIVSGLRRALVRVELFWPQTYAAFESVDAYAQALRDSLVEEETAIWLAQRGVGVEQAARLRIQNSSAASGGLRESRLFFDALFNGASKRFREETPIDGAATESIEILA